MNRPAWILAIILLAATVQTAFGEIDEGRRTALVGQFIEHHAAPRFEQLHEATGVMGAAVSGFCAQPGADGLKRSREAFRRAYLAWMAVQHIKFGPSLRDDANFKLQFWPDKHGRTGRQLNGLLLSDAPIPDASALGGLSAAVQGFPALERLLFEADAAGFFGATGARRCALAISIAQNMGALTATLAADWRSSMPKDPADFLKRAYRNYLEMFAVIADLKLKRPLGKSLKGVRPKRAEAWRSGLSFAAIARNLGALGAVFEGESDWPGLRTALDEDPETVELADSLAQQIIYGAEVSAARSDTLAEAVTTEDGRRFLEFLVVHVEQLKDTSIELLARPLGISEGFNALDGD